MKKIITTTIIVFATLTAFCQEKVILPFEFQHKNSIQLELFGHGVFYSVNYERILIFSGKYAFSVDGDRIEFTRDYRNASSDTYIDRYVLYRKD
jgi:hypothetical protein